MANSPKANKWYKRLNKGPKMQRLGWNVVFYLGRIFSFGRWNSLKKFSIKDFQTSTTVIAQDFPKKPEKKLSISAEPSVFENLPSDIHQEIAQYLNLKAINQLARTNKKLNTLFQPVMAVNKLLQCVAYGQQNEAEEILKKHPELLLKKGTVTDYSGRTFKNITAFQYALWARDRHMWVMLRKYLPEKFAKAQLNELEEKGTKYGKHFDFAPLTKAIKNYLKKLNSLRIHGPAKNKLLANGCLKIGLVQRDVPAHVAQQYNSKCIPFSNPENDKEELQRSLKVYYFDNKQNETWFPLSDSLGKGSVIVHGKMHKTCRFIVWGNGVDCYLDIKFDLQAITHLNEVRDKEYNDLKLELNQQQKLTI